MRPLCYIVYFHLYCIILYCIVYCIILHIVLYCKNTKKRETSNTNMRTIKMLNWADFSVQYDWIGLYIRLLFSAVLR